MLLDILFLLAGFGLLVLGGNWLLRSSVALASRLGMSSMMIGLTVVSFATSMPELIVSLKAALVDSSGIALGNVIGSNVANIGLVLGVTLLITPMNIPRKFFKTDWIFLIVSTAMAMFFMIYYDGIMRWHGIIFILYLSFFIYFLIKTQKPSYSKSNQKRTKVYEKWTIIFLYLVLGAGGLWLGSELLVNSAKSIALSFNVPESVIGLTVVAVGTSVPELAASVIAAIKGERSISFGNLIGSNIFNILSVLGITAIIQPIIVEDVRFINNDIWWMLGFSLILLPMALIGKKYRLSRPHGLILVLAYLAFVYLAF
ncbi:calcium/sodium antiporter [Weeksellaceae bacterium KMM 9713]|uniref:Calcium/sodium antiporter n=1 Tax=Profundicola chukchiensis TaxID=2961959 RepID=A0A9X4N476_9FLAO|nr:calcium/sodium antiporter [Profundicola chukchiensis]MDG4946719.1 calcium/sodium antiporter [Profundicola chukchiensis]